MKIFLLAAAATTVIAGASAAQTQSQRQSKPPGDGAAQMAVLNRMPEACRRQLDRVPQQTWTENIPIMQSMMPPPQGGSGQNSSGATRAFMEAMRTMSAPMMVGMMIPDADVAFLCSMIPHHQGAIDMAQVVLRNGQSEEIKKLAEQTIKEQERDIKELTQLLEKHAK